MASLSVADVENLLNTSAPGGAARGAARPSNRSLSVEDVESLLNGAGQPQPAPAAAPNFPPDNIRPPIAAASEPGFRAELPELADSFSLKNATGVITPGNIDLTKRPTVRNPDGSISTVRSMSFNDNGREVLVPTVSDDGRIMSDQEAIDAYRKTGKHLGMFKTPEDANAYAESLHLQQSRMYGPNGEPGILQTVGNAAQQTFEDLRRGYLGSAAGFYNLGANALHLVNRAGDYLAEKTGIGSTSDQNEFGQAERYLRNTARNITPAPDPNAGFLSKVNEGLGAAPVTLGEYLTGARLAGPVLGMAGVGALNEADKGLEPALIAAIRDATLGKLLTAAPYMSRPAQAITMGTAGGAMAAGQGGDTSDVAANAAVMAALGLTGEPGNLTMRGAFNRPPVPPRRGRVEPTLQPPPANDSLGPVSGPPVRPESPPLVAEPPRTQPAPAATESNPRPPAETPPGVSAPAVPSPQPVSTGSTPPKGPAVGGVDTVVTPRGRRIEVQPEIIEASDLITSHSPDLIANPRFPAELQPRDRERAASSAQIAEIAGNLQPELLGRSGSATEGAPIIGPDNVVESGNARSLGVIRAYQQGLPGAQAYREYLASQGFDVSGFKNPVLVRRRVTQLEPADRQAFTREANERSTLSMGAAEQAAADAKAMPAPVLDLYRGGDLHSAANADFVRRLVESVIPASERGAVLTADGRLSQDGLRRLENALFARAYGEDPIMASLRESTDTNIKAIGDALNRVAPEIAKLNHLIETGQVSKGLDVAPALLDAANMVRQARDKGVRVRDLVNQNDMFGGGAKPATVEALRLFFRDENFTRPRSAKDIADSLRFYADQAGRNESGPGLFPGQKPIESADVLRLSRERLDGGLLPDAAEMRLPSTGGKYLSLGDVQKLLSDSRGDVMGATSRMARPGEQLPASAAATQNMAPGVNYVGSIQTTYKPAAASKGETIRRGKILRDLVKDLGSAIYEGRIKDKRTLGFYRKGIEETRIRKVHDIETASHEVAHLLDDRFPELRKMWAPATAANAAIRAELKGVSYDQSKLYEGFAEFIRLWATQQNQARAKAPQFYQQWEGWLLNRAPDNVRQAMMRLQDQAHAWFDQDSLTRARSKIGPDEVINGAQDSLWARLRQSTVDDLEGIRRMERTLTGGLEPAGAYETARLTRGASETVNGALTLGTLKVKADGSHTYEGKSLSDILKPVAKNLDDFEMYAVGRAAAELMGQGRENLFTRDEIKAMLGLETPEFRKAFAEYQDWNKGILDFAQAKGVIDPMARQFWQRLNYLPFHRVGSGGGAEGGRAAGDIKAIRELKGGTENLKQPLQNMVNNAAMLIRVALQNEARQKVAKLADMNGGARFMVRIPTEERGIKIGADQIERVILDALGVQSKGQLGPTERALFDQIMQNMGPVAQLIVRGQAPAGKDVVAVLHGGKPTYYEVADPLLYRAFESIEREGRSALMSVIGAARRLGQTGVTLTPDFAARNFLRDQLMAGIMSQHGYIPFVHGVSGLYSRLLRDQSYKDYIANGGGIAGHIMDDAAVRAQLDRWYQAKGITPETVLTTPGRLYGMLQKLAEAAEQATRVGEYKRAVARGEHPRAAAYAAREVSTDFAMRGDAKDVFVRGDAATLSFLYDSVMFFKAGINGLDRFYRGVVYDKGKVKTVGLTAALALMSAGLYSVNKDNPEYDQLEDWDKDANWHFFIPDGQGGNLHFRMPKLWEVGAISSLAERTMEAMLNGPDRDTGWKLLNVIRQSLNLDPVPQVLNPALEVAMNRDRFRNAPIEPEGIRQLEPWARARPGTSMTMRRLGEATRDLPRALQISPAQAEHLLRGYLTTWGSYLLDISDSAIFDRARPDKRTDQLPVLKSFYRQEPAQSTRHVKELYDAIREAQEVRATMRAMIRGNRAELGEEVANSPENLMYGQLNDAAKRLQVYHREANQVVGAQSLDEVQQMARTRAKLTNNPGLVGNAQMRGQWNDIGALKRVLLDDMTRERNQFAEERNRDVKARRQELRAVGGR